MKPQPFLLDDGQPLGTVYGVLLNDAATVRRLAPQFDAPPYKAAPRAPVLYIKPRNTYARDGAAVAIPAEPGAVRLDATIGLLIGAPATRVEVRDAMAHVAGFVLASDITLPHDNYFRPAIRQRCRDGFCPMSGPYAPGDGYDIASATLQVSINGRPAWRRGFAGLVRPAAQLIADVTAFMTLSRGDVLLLGPGEGSPLARPGDLVEIEAPGLGRLAHRIVAEAAAAQEGAQA
ncbi:fumarylacetoacetate hydrolase family protein [Achromobacter sp. Marseille-Q4962]|uniref:fumarylacetoacetate hydrolase family protein n=1 Tax=Achromobacter sp. Marseille-Q4962 TaxID=2942202 RepID=UPI002073B741|nr:fumarylacetoacetate hydrolase family protein [Achromobacter sp. Marseille-Q4962]